jgi:CheY-like chemotaxis protein
MVSGAITQIEGRGVILVADDDAEVLRFISTVLQKYGFKVQVAGDGAEGLDCYHKHRHELCLVVTDILMPNMNGLELAMAIRGIDIKLPILLISGYSDLQIEAEGRKNFPFVRKPFLAADLMRKIDALLSPEKAESGSSSG